MGFCFGKGGIPTLDGACVLIDKDTAIEYRERTKPAPIPIQVAQPKDNPSTSSEDLKLSPSLQHQEAKTSSPIQTAIKKHFYGNIDLDPVKAKMDFATIVDEVVQQFTAKLGVEVSISVEIQAKFKDGFDEAMQRTIKENCKVLRFSSSEFEEE